MLTQWLRRAFRPGEIATQARREYSRARALGQQLSAGTEALAESAQFLERTAESANQTIEQLQAVVAGQIDEVVATSPRLADRVIRRLAGEKPAELSAAAADLLNYASSHEGFAAQAGLWFNPPVGPRHIEGGVVAGDVNERIVELPFVASAICALPVGAVVADIGAAESTLSLSLASLGYKVFAVDPRGYPLEHPNLVSVTSTLADWPSAEGSLDAAVCLSVIEHLGLNVYGEGGTDEAADTRALHKLRSLLKPGGLLVFTAPTGAWSVGPTERSYDDEHLDRLFAGWTIETRLVIEQADDGAWIRQPTSRITSAHGVILVTARV